MLRKDAWVELVLLWTNVVLVHLGEQAGVWQVDGRGSLLVFFVELVRLLGVEEHLLLLLSRFLVVP